MSLQNLLETFRTDKRVAWLGLGNATRRDDGGQGPLQEERTSCLLQERIDQVSRVLAWHRGARSRGGFQLLLQRRFSSDFDRVFHIVGIRPNGGGLKCHRPDRSLRRDLHHQL